MLVWVLLGVLLGAAGIAVLGWFALRLWRQVRDLGRDVAAAAERIESATAAIPELRPPAR